MGRRDFVIPKIFVKISIVEFGKSPPKARVQKWLTKILIKGERDSYQSFAASSFSPRRRVGPHRLKIAKKGPLVLTPSNWLRPETDL